MVAILLFHDAYAPKQDLTGVIRHLPSASTIKLRMLGAALVYDRTRANSRNFNATHWIGHASAMEHGTIFFDLKIPLSEPDEHGLVSFSMPLPENMLPSFSSAYNTAFVTVSYGLCLHWETGEVLSVEPVTISQNAPEESGRMNKKTRLATFVTRNLNWYYHNNSSYLAATVDMDEVDNLTSGSTLSLRLHARSIQVKSLRFTVEQRLELSLPYDGQPRRVKQKAVIASSVRELASTSPSEFKKRYFITMPTLCTTINSPIISTKYTVRIQMTSARTAMLTLEVPVTMYSKGSFINGLPSPMSSPGLTPQWANIILDSHQKNFADECAICFSEIKHSFAPAELELKADGVEDDVASCGTDESDDYGVNAGAARPATFVARPCKDDRPGPPLGGTVSAEEASAVRGLSGPLCDNASSAAESSAATTGGAADADIASDLDARGPGGAPVGGDFDAAYDPAVGGVVIAEADPTVRDAAEPGESAVALDGRHPDMLAEEIMLQPSHLCSKEQLELLYKTCRYREHAMRRGVAYASCGHAFHPLCLLEYEKHAGQRSGLEGATKCPLCRQPYTVKHFIPDDNLRSLCLEHTLNEAIVTAESAAKDADEKAKDAVNARSLAAQAAQNAARLRLQAGPGFCSPVMADRLSALIHSTGATPPGASSAANAGLLALPPSGPMRPPSHVVRVGSGSGFDAAPGPGGAPRRSEGRESPGGGYMTPPRQSSTALQSVRRVHNTPAAAAAAAHVAAAAVAGAVGMPPPPADPGLGIDLGGQVPVHEQIASMRISADAESLTSAAQHPEVVLGDEDGDEG